MPLVGTAEGRWIDGVTAIGAFVALLDSFSGAFLSLGIDWARPMDFLMAMSFLLPFPMYLLDVRFNARVATGLLGLFIFRWALMCFAGAYPALVNPLRGNILLLFALALLQFSKAARWHRGSTA